MKPQSVVGMFGSSQFAYQSRCPRCALPPCRSCSLAPDASCPLRPWRPLGPATTSYVPFAVKERALPVRVAAGGRGTRDARGGGDEGRKSARQPGRAKGAFRRDPPPPAGERHGASSTGTKGRQTRPRRPRRDSKSPELPADWAEITAVVDVVRRHRAQLQGDAASGPLPRHDRGSGGGADEDEGDGATKQGTALPCAPALRLLATTRPQRLNLAIRELGRRGACEDALRLAWWVRCRRPWDASDHTVAAAVGAAASCWGGRRAREEFQRMRAWGTPLGPASATALVDALAKDAEVALEETLDTLARLQGEGVTLNIRTYNAALHACALHANASEALALYTLVKTQFPSPSLLPTTYTYAALLRAVDAGGMPGAAKSLFPDIHAATLAGELPPDVMLYQHCLHLAAESRDVALGEEVLRGISKAGVSMNAHVYNAAVSLYASVGDLETALGWMDRMAAAGGATRPDDVTATLVLTAAARAQAPLSTVEALQARLFSDLSIPRTTTNDGATLGALRSCGDRPAPTRASLCEAWLRGMAAAGRAVEAHHGHTAVAAMLEAEDWRGAVRVYDFLVEERGVEPTPVLLGQVAVAWERMGEVGRAAEWRDLQRAYRDIYGEERR